MDDTLGLGLDLSSFSEDKRKILEDFLVLFEKLEKYDGKQYNPILGTGLTEFNTSLQNTTRTLDEIAVKLSNLTSLLSNTATAAGASASAFSEVSSATNKNTQAVVNNERAKQAQEKTNQQVLRTIRDEEAVITQQTATEAKAAQVSLTNLKAVTEARRQNTEAVKAAAIEELNEAKVNLENAKANEVVQRTSIAAEREEERRIQASQRAQAQAAAANAATNNTVGVMVSLKNTLKEQAAVYAQLYSTQGKNAVATKAALADYKATERQIHDIDVGLGRAQAGLFGMGRGASTFYNQIRTLAYILPGIGIAGLFNLAFEAISKAADATGLLNSRAENYRNFLVETNKYLAEQIQLSDNLLQLDIKLNQKQFGPTGQDSRLKEVKEARGYDAVTMATMAAKNAETEFFQSEANLLATGNTRASLKDELDRRIALMDGYKRELEQLDRSIANIVNPNKESEGKKILRNRKEIRQRQRPSSLASVSSGAAKPKKYPTLQGTKEVLEKRKELINSQLKLEQDTYAIRAALLETNINEEENYFKTRSNLAKINSDQERKLFVETAKDDISVKIDKNRKILADERSTLKERIAALDAISRYEKRINDLNAVNVTGTVSNPNLSSTPDEKTIAINKQRDEDRKSQIKHDDDIEKQKIIFYQRDIKSLTDLHNSSLEENARYFEAIFKNEKNSVDVAMDAFIKYILTKQDIQDNMLKRDQQKGASGPGGKTSLTPLEKDALNSDNYKAKINLQADAEKQLYDIVYSRKEKEFRDIKDLNEAENTDSKRAHAVELSELNNLYEGKLIKYEEYHRRREAMDEKYRKKELDDAIKDDNEDIDRLLQFRAKLEEEIDQDKRNLAAAIDANAHSTTIEGAAKTKIDVDASKAKLDANVEVRTGVNNELDKKMNQLDKDEDARQQNNYKDKEKHKAQQQVVDEAYKIGEALITLEQTIEDTIYEKRLEHLQRMKETIDEQYNYEIAAIQNSSLSSKDKHALDVQLRAQKEKADKDEQIQEKKIRHEQAVFDQKMAFAKIIISTQEAVMAALTIPPPEGEILASERGLLGAISLATAASANIPSYGDGTEDHPGGAARVAERGTPEIVKEPYKSPYFVFKDSILNLPRHTQVIPLRQDVNLEPSPEDSGMWFRWLAKQMKSEKKQTIINNNKISINLGFEEYKYNKLYAGS